MRALIQVGALAVVAVLQATLVTAETSLYIPGFDPQPITVDVEGVDAQGHTTYILAAGVSSGTFTSPAFVGTATLVEDATEANLVYVNTGAFSLTVSEDCAIANGRAVCTGVVDLDGTPAPIHGTETVRPFAVQAGATAASSASSTGSMSASSGGSASSSASTPTASAGSGVSSGGPSQTASPTSSGAIPSASAPTGNNSGVGKKGASVGLSLGVVGLLSAFFL